MCWDFMMLTGSWKCRDSAVEQALSWRKVVAGSESKKSFMDE